MTTPTSIAPSKPRRPRSWLQDAALFGVLLGCAPAPTTTTPPPASAAAPGPATTPTPAAPEAPPEEPPEDPPCSDALTVDAMLSEQVERALAEVVPPQPKELRMLCHPHALAELRFAPGQTTPQRREAALRQLRSKVAASAAAPPEDRPDLFFAVGYAAEDEPASVIPARAEALRALALEAGVDPEALLLEAELMDPPRPQSRRSAVLLASIPVGCLL